MHGLDSLIEEGEDGTVFRDVIMLALLGFATIVILLLPHLHPPTEIADPVKAPGNIIVEARWLDNIDVDVDLWVEAPGDKPVGYSNKSGRIFNLLRDDLGNSGDLGRPQLRNGVHPWYAGRKLHREPSPLPQQFHGTAD